MQRLTGPQKWSEYPTGETFDQSPVFDPLAPAPEPTFEFDQTVTW